VPISAWSVDRAHVAVPVDLTVYAVPAVLRAAYKLTDRVFVYLQRDTSLPDRLWAVFFGRERTADVEPFVLEFMNEVADQQLRVQLEAQFHDVRTLIVAQAFAEGNLLTADDDDGDYRTDPAGARERR
jgi:His-Xaa-Ser system protein HxsD